MPIRAIFFDVGETLIDETRLMHGWADTMGVDRAEFVATLDEIIAKGETYRAIFERLRPGFDVRAAVAERKRNGTDFRIEARDLYADAKPCLSELTQDGWFVGIAGNQPPTAKAALESFGLAARLITTSAELGVDKPSPDFFRKTLAKACDTFLKFAPPLLGVVRRDAKVRDAIRAQTPLLTRHPGCDAARDVEAIAQQVAQVS